MPVGCDAQLPQISDEVFRVFEAEVSRGSDGVLLQEPQQMLGCRPISIGCVQRRPLYALVILDPLLSQVRYRHRVKRQCRSGSGLELTIDLRGELPGRLPVDTRAGTPAPPLFVVAEIPDLAPEKCFDAADAELGFLGRLC